MQLHHEKPAAYAIHSYTEHSVTIHETTYTQSLFVDAQRIQALTQMEALTSIHDLKPNDLLELIHPCPEILLIGQTRSSFLLPEQQAFFLQRKIGVECMSLDAACRTFNILLSEERNVGLLLIFSSKA